MNKRIPTAVLAGMVVSLAGTLYAQEPVVSAGGPLDLKQCTEIMLSNNFDIRRAKETLSRQHGVVVEARAGLLPSVVASSSLSQIDKDRIPSFGGQSFGSDVSWGADVNINQTVFAGGRNIAAFSQQKLLQKASQLEMNLVVQNVLLELKERFYGLLLARSQVGVQEELVRLLEEELDSERKKRDAGTVSDFNVLRADVALANSRSPLIRAQNNLRLAHEELRRILGMASHSGNDKAVTIEVKGELVFEPYEITLDEALDQAGKNRVELKRLDTIVEAQKQGVNVAAAGFWPEISVFAGYGADKSQFSSHFRDELHGWQAGVRGNWMIFDSLKTSGRLAQAKSDLSSARLSLEQTRVEIDVETRRAVSLLQEARELVTASFKVVEQGEESLRLARARFDVGAATQLDVLDSQVALTEARNNEVQALHDYGVARARLERTIGFVDQTVTGERGA